MSVEHMMHSQSPMNSIWWSNIRWFIEHSLTLRCDLYDLCGRVRESVLWLVRQWCFMIQISLLDTIHQVLEWHLFDIDSLQSLAIHWQFSEGPLLWIPIMSKGMYHFVVWSIYNSKQLTTQTDEIIDGNECDILYWAVPNGHIFYLKSSHIEVQYIFVSK